MNVKNTEKAAGKAKVVIPTVFTTAPAVSNALVHCPASLADAMKM